MPGRSRDLDLGTRAVSVGVASLLAVALVLSAALPAAGAPPPSAPPVATPANVDAETVAAVDLLRRAEHVARVAVIRGRLVVATTGTGAARLFAHDVERGPGALRISRDGQLSFSRDGDAASLHAPDGLISIDGAGRLPLRFDALVAKYELRTSDPVVIDTGRAVPVTATERATGTVREVLYVDVDTGLLVRRETYDEAARPRRVVAFTAVVVDPVGDPEPATDEGSEVAVRWAAAPPVDASALTAAGFVVPGTLPDGLVLLTATELAATSVPTAHLVYGDGLYTISVFQQLGRVDPASTDGGVRTAVGDGDVWRWPGSEPRRLVWGGDGVTFTVLADAPLDLTLAAVAGLPRDPALSILDRLRRGVQRIGDWVRDG